MKKNLRKKTLKAVALFCLFGLMNVNCFGQIITFPVSGLTGTTSGNVASSAAVAGLSAASSTLGRGPGLTAASSNAGYNSVVSTTSANNYYTITLTPSSGFQISVTGFSVTLQRSGSGPTSATLTSSVDNYGSTLGTFASIPAGNANYNITGLTITNQTTPIIFRIQTNGIAGNLRVSSGAGLTNGVSINGTVTATTPTWNGTAWSNTTGPTAALDAIIAGTYSTTTNGTFTAKNLTVSSTGSLNVNADTNITVAENITNNAAATAFVVESNANIIQSGTTNGNVGAITVKRNSTGMKRLDYTYWSAPVTGQELLAFSPQTIASRFYGIDEANNSFVPITAAGTNFALAKGYSIRAPNNYLTTDQIFEGVFTGVPNNGDVNIPVTNSGAGRGFNLIGNPYPSELAATAFFSANPNISTLYFWSHFSQAATSGANYATLNGSGGTASVSGSAQPNGNIAVGQGFVAFATTSGNAVFNNTMRVGITGDQFFRTNNTGEKNRVWLNFSNQDGAQNQMLIAYVAGATNEFDTKFDGELFEKSGSKLYSVINDKQYVIQGKGLPFASDDTVKIGFVAATAGLFTIAIDHVDGLFLGEQNIFLKDNTTGILHNLKNSSYTFSANVGIDNARFELRYQNSTLEVAESNQQAIIVSNQNGILNVNAGNAIIKNVKVFDVSGRLLLEDNAVNAANTAISSLKASQQVLVVQITTNEDLIINKKVVF